MKTLLASIMIALTLLATTQSYARARAEKGVCINYGAKIADQIAGQCVQQLEADLLAMAVANEMKDREGFPVTDRSPICEDTLSEMRAACDFAADLCATSRYGCIHSLEDFYRPEGPIQACINRTEVHALRDLIETGRFGVLSPSNPLTVGSFAFGGCVGFSTH